MANKGKEKPIEPIEEVEVIEEPKAEAVKDSKEAFIDRKLKAINAMQKPAKAERLANRVLRKARNK